jgi:hypothetical protein
MLHRWPILLTEPDSTALPFSPPIESDLGLVAVQDSHLLHFTELPYNT